MASDSLLGEILKWQDRALAAESELVKCKQTADQIIADLQAERTQLREQNTALGVRWCQMFDRAEKLEARLAQAEAERITDAEIDRCYGT